VLTFIRTFIIRYTIKQCVYLNIIMFLNNTLRTFQYYLSRIFEELTRFDVSRVYFGQYTAFERCINLAPSKSRAIPALTCTKRSRTVFFKFSCLAILAINDCLTPIDNRGRLALFCSIRCKIIATLFPRKKLFSCIYLSGLRYEIIMLCLIHIKMYCFYSH